MRKNFISLLDGLSSEQLNQVLPGFKNTIIWNFGHAVVSQQKLCYAPANLDLKIPQSWLDLFQKGTKTFRNITDPEIQELKTQALALTEELERDLKKGTLHFQEPLQTGFGLLLENAQDAADFSALHDSLHLGYAQAQRRAILESI